MALYETTTSTPEGAMALPADFPQPPADRESLAAAVAWTFQVLMWLIARAVAGDQWWIGQEAAPPHPLQPRDAATCRPAPSGEGGAGPNPEMEAARSEAGLARSRMALQAERQAQPLQGERAQTPPDPPNEPRPALAPTIRTGARSQTRRAPRPIPARQAATRRPSAGHPWPTTGPPLKTGAPAKQSSHA